MARAVIDVMPAGMTTSVSRRDCPASAHHSRTVAMGNRGGHGDGDSRPGGGGDIAVLRTGKAGEPARQVRSYQPVDFHQGRCRRAVACICLQPR